MSNMITYKGYAGTVDYSAEDEVFYGKVHGLNDLVTFEGKSVNELKKAFQEAVTDYLETCQQLGKEPEKTFKGSFNVRVSQDMHRQAALMAAKMNITLNEFIKKAISYAVKHEKDIDGRVGG